MSSASPAFICTACRLELGIRLSLTTRSAATFARCRPLSSRKYRGEDQRLSPFTRSHTGRHISTNPVGDSQTLGHGSPESDRAEGAKRAAIGRYSRAPLNPGQLLQQLEIDGERSHIVKNSSRLGGRAESERSHEKQQSRLIDADVAENRRRKGFKRVPLVREYRASKDDEVPKDSSRREPFPIIAEKPLSSPDELLARAVTGDKATKNQNDPEAYPGAAEPPELPLDKSLPSSSKKPSDTEPLFTDFQPQRLPQNVHDDVMTWIKHSGRAIEQRKPAFADRIFQNVIEHERVNKASPLPLFLYEHMIYMFMALRRPKHAVEAWKMIDQVGLKPTVRTWTIMMRGSLLPGVEAGGVEKLWHSMRASGVLPDEHAWGARILALIANKKANRALDALQELGDEWFRAQQRPVKQQATALAGFSSRSELASPAKPSVGIANSALSALLYNRQASKDKISRVLSWMAKCGLQPDLITFNNLINYAMINNNFTEATGLLERMQSRGIEPDDTTWFVMVDALFRSGLLTDLSHEEQSDKIMSFILSIDENGGLGKKGYALVVNHLLKHFSNETAARRVLKHMRERGLETTSHIYTIVMDFYFAQDPPDFEAAESLWNELAAIRSGERRLDAIFYDRAIERYAAHHHVLGVSRVVDVLERMTREGMVTSWTALHAAARAFHERGERSRFRKLIDDIRASRGIASEGVRHYYGQLPFWEFVSSTGLLKPEEMADLNNLLRNHEVAKLDKVIGRSA